MLKAVIMDFDGLIVDTETAVFGLFKDYFAKNFRYQLPVHEFLVCVGSNAEVLFKKLRQERGFEIDTQEFLEDISLSYKEKTEALPARPGVEDFIKEAKSLGLKLALATSSKNPKAKNHLNRLGLLPYFDSLITADDVERVKPEPDLFLKALEALGIPAEEALAVEDSQNGCLAAVKAGLRVLIIPNSVTFHSNFTGYFKKAESLEHISLKAEAKAWV